LASGGEGGEFSLNSFVSQEKEEKSAIERVLPSNPPPSPPASSSAAVLHSAPLKEWEAAALELRSRHPGEHPSTIANRLASEPHWFSYVDGRKVKQLFERYPSKAEVAG
jgi:hypothetical protein